MHFLYFVAIVSYLSVIESVVIANTKDNEIEAQQPADKIDTLLKNVVNNVYLVDVMLQNLNKNGQKVDQGEHSVGKLNLSAMIEATERYQSAISSLMRSEEIGKDMIQKLLKVLNKEVPFLWTVIERSLRDSWSIANDVSQHFVNKPISPKYISEIQSTLKQSGLTFCKIMAANPLWGDIKLFDKCYQIFSSL